MIKVDLATILPKRGGPYLLGIIPGMVFEFSVALYDPIRARTVIEHLKQIYPFNGYSLLILFVLSCLIIGEIFYILAWFVEWIFDFLYWAQRYFLVRLTLGSNWLYKWMGRIQGTPPKSYVRRLWPIIMWARKKQVPFEVRPVLACQRIAATQLLKQKYGLTLCELSTQSAADEMQAWIAVSGQPPAIVREAILTSRVITASGLAALWAQYVEPAAHNRYLVIFSAVLLIVGFFQASSLIRNRREPIRANLLKLRMLMEEIVTTARLPSKEMETSPRETSFDIASGGNDDSQ